MKWYQFVTINVTLTWNLLTTDINECSLNSCQVHCTNTNGSYYCSCDTSSVIATDGIHCLGRLCIN